MSEKKTAWTYESFLTALAKVLWEIHQSRKLRSQANDVLSMFGISVPDGTATDGSVPAFALANATEDPDTRISASVKLADLSDAAKARREASRIRDLRRMAYGHLVGMTKEDPYGYGPEYGTCGRRNCPNHPPAGSNAKPSEITRHFAALDFPMPTTSTEVAGYVRQGDDEVYIHANVDGEVTEEQAKANLLPFASHSPQHALTVAAFGEGSHQEELVHSIRANTRTVWADSSDIK